MDKTAALFVVTESQKQSRVAELFTTYQQNYYYSATKKTELNLNQLT